MKKNNPLAKISYVLFWILAGILITFIVYYGSIPTRYRYEPGKISDVDITAPRSIVDPVETEKRANEAKLSVSGVYVRSEEISGKGAADILEFFAMVKEIRDGIRAPDGTYLTSIQDAAAQIVNKAVSQFGISLSPIEGNMLISMDDTVLGELINRCSAISISILMNKVDENMLLSEINMNTDGSETADNMPNSEFIKKLLTGILKPNIVLDEAATETNRIFAYEAVKRDNPVMIEKGARIVIRGQEIDQATYTILKSLDMIEISSFDFVYLSSVFLYVAIIVLGMGFYLMRTEEKMMKNRRNMISISIAALLTLISSIYLSGISPLLIPVCFFSVICATYFGTQTAFIISCCIIAITFPMAGYDAEFLAVSIFGVFVTTLISGDRKRKYDSAFLILATSLFCVLGSFAYNLMIKGNPAKIASSALWATIMGGVSVILAIGLMPIFELISNTISPIRLIDLSQPGHALQKRLFMEAPGTFHHSIMVANLADAAAEAIGANALLSKVGAYYHDVGKVEMPEYFTENQNGMNPHDHLTPEESAAIILAHPENGMKLARKYRLPPGLSRFIQEHHGTTTLAFFHHKAKELAAANGEPEPLAQKYKYKGPTPSSKESAILMLADTCEAAIKSTGITDLNEAQDFFRKLIKQKIDMDQLDNSELSFRDIELIIRAFVQVYAGVFHERIKYPDDTTPNRK